MKAVRNKHNKEVNTRNEETHFETSVPDRTLATFSDAMVKGLFTKKRDYFPKIMIEECQNVTDPMLSRHNYSGSNRR